MTTVIDSQALDQLSDEQLVECLSAGAVDPEEFGAEIKRREQAEQAQREQAGKREQSRKLAEMRWHDAAHAQFEQAEADCRGVLLSDYGRAHGPADAFGLWSGPWREVERYASEELLLWFQDHARLTFQVWQRQGSQAANARRMRDQRDLAAMDKRAETAPRAAPVPDYRPRPAVPVPTYRPAAPKPAGSMARYITALGHLQRQANQTARALSHVNGGIR